MSTTTKTGARTRIFTEEDAEALRGVPTRASSNHDIQWLVGIPIPVVEDLEEKILEAITSGVGELDMKDWHTCETTHCLAGWAEALAGNAGMLLQSMTGSTELTGAAIYQVSMGYVPNFFVDGEEALADLRARVAASWKTPKPKE